MKRMICLLLALCLLAACAAAGAESPHFEGKPWINSSFYGLWPAERPAVEDSFELYANYDTYANALAKNDRREYSPLGDAQLLANRQTASLCTDPDLAGPEAECMRILYGLYKDVKQEEDAIAPVLPYAERLRAVKSLEELTALIREDGWMYGNAFLVGDLSVTDREFGKYYIVFAMPDMIDYLPMDAEAAEIPGRDIDTAKRKLQRMGWSAEELQQLIDQILTYTDSLGEWDLAPTTESEADLESRAAFGLISTDDIRNFSGPLYELLKVRGLTKEGAEAEPAYRVQFREHLMKFKIFWQEKNLETIKAILALSMYDAAASYLPVGMTADEVEDPASALAALVPQALREQGYARNFVSPERIELYKKLVQEYKDAMRARIQRNDWVSEATKQEIYKKIDKLAAAEVLYPYGEFDCTLLLEKLRSCEHFAEAHGWCSRFGNQCAVYFAGLDYTPGNRYTRAAGRVGTDYAEGHYLTEDNAFYVGGASLCDYTLDMTSRETILGTFGAHLSHEFSHAFDPNCVQFNADFTGSLFATDEDKEIFDRKVAAIVKQVSSIEVFDGYYSNGERQIGEILADLTGMSLTLDMAKEIENFDYDAYFRAFAYFFCTYLPSREAMSPESAHAIHPYPYLRINFAVQHFDEFYQTYPSVTEGTPMYLAPEDRILVW